MEHEYRKQHSSLYLLDQLADYDDGPIGRLPSVAEYGRTFDPRNSFIAKKSDYTYTIMPSIYFYHRGEEWNYGFDAKFQLAPTHQRLNYHRNNADTTITRNSFRVMLPWLHSSLSNKSNTFFMQLMGNITSKTPDLVNLVDMTDDTDPLNVTIGNTHLKDETTYYVDWFVSLTSPQSQSGHEVGIK